MGIPLITTETKVAVQLGAIVTAALSLVTGTIFMTTIKSNGEQALKEIQEMNQKFETLQDQHRRLWYEYERTHPMLSKDSP